MTNIKEDGIVNAAGPGNIAGIGIGPKGEPGRPGKLMRRQKFGGCEAFVVDSEYFHKCRMGKRKYTRYENYVGNDEIGEEIRQYGRHPKTCNEAIIVMDEKTGCMMYLKYGKNKWPH